MSLRLSNTRIARSSHGGGGAFQPRPRLRPAALRQRPSHRADRSRGRATRPHARTARQGHAALGRIATSVRGRERQGDLGGGGRSHRRGHGSRGVRGAGHGRARRRSACAGRRSGGDRRDLAGAARSDMAFHARGRGRRRGASGDLRRRASSPGGADIRECRGRRHSAARRGDGERNRLPPTVLRGARRRRHRRLGGPLPVEFLAAPGRGLPVHVLVPGPHVLNGALDLINGRIHLGAARLTYAGLVIVAISTGLLLGLALLGVTLPVDEAGRVVPFWQDVIAAGVAVAAYSIFFSTPLNMMPWPVAVGMLSHALRWGAITVLGFGAAIGTLLACLIVGVILTPVARRRHMPFAAIGFASVVSMMPGILLFRMASGLMQIAGSAQTSLELISATIADGTSALISILAMSLGLIIPKLVIDDLSERSTKVKS